MNLPRAGSGFSGTNANEVAHRLKAREFLDVLNHIDPNVLHLEATDFEVKNCSQNISCIYR